jgi:hypothetical protein
MKGFMKSAAKPSTKPEDELAEQQPAAAGDAAPAPAPTPAGAAASQDAAKGPATSSAATGSSVPDHAPPREEDEEGAGGPETRGQMLQRHKRVGDGRPPPTLLTARARLRARHACGLWTAELKIDMYPCPPRVLQFGSSGSCIALTLCDWCDCHPMHACMRRSCWHTKRRCNAWERRARHARRRTPLCICVISMQLWLWEHLDCQPHCFTPLSSSPPPMIKNTRVVWLCQLPNSVVRCVPCESLCRTSWQSWMLRWRHAMRVSFSSWMQQLLLLLALLQPLLILQLLLLLTAPAST